MNVVWKYRDVYYHKEAEEVYRYGLKFLDVFIIG